MPPDTIPMPPDELRRLVGLWETQDYDNPTGAPIYDHFGLPHAAYDSVLDFGCGCGRIARQLLQQSPRPKRYVGVDAHAGMIDWCRNQLTPADPNFRFVHHDVYSPNYARMNSVRLAEPFPAPDGDVTLFIASSVYTHLCRPQAAYYLGELARVLAPGGVAFTSWFFFDRESFPFLGAGPYSLHTNEADFAEAAVYDRTWFLEAVRSVGLCVARTVLPPITGHQWIVFLRPRTAGATDAFPLGADGAEWLCGATAKAAAAPAATATEHFLRTSRGPFARVDETEVVAERPPAPPPFGPLAELDAIRRSWSWRAGRALTAPARLLRRLLRT